MVLGELQNPGLAGSPGRQWSVVMVKIVYVQQNAKLIQDDGLGYVVVKDQPWADDDPLVKRWPEFFGPEPVQLMRTVPAPEQEPQRRYLRRKPPEGEESPSW